MASPAGMDNLARRLATINQSKGQLFIKGFGFGEFLPRGCSDRKSTCLAGFVTNDEADSLVKEILGEYRQLQDREIL
jgi:hypothetical protein